MPLRIRGRDFALLSGRLVLGRFWNTFVAMWSSMLSSNYTLLFLPGLHRHRYLVELFRRGYHYNEDADSLPIRAGKWVMHT